MNTLYVKMSPIVKMSILIVKMNILIVRMKTLIVKMNILIENVPLDYKNEHMVVTMNK